MVRTGEFGDWELTDILEGLITKSLVHGGRGGTPRFRLLETVKHYARRRLDISGEADMVSNRHLHYYVALVETLREALREAEQAARRRAWRWKGTMRAPRCTGRRSEGAEPRLAVGGWVAAALGDEWAVEGGACMDRGVIGDATDAERAAAPLWRRRSMLSACWPLDRATTGAP